MSIISPVDFVGPELNIANTDTVPVQEAVQWMIDEYEPKLLTDLLGETLYDELLAGLILDPIPAKWTALRDKVKPAILRYVWFWYIESQINFTAGTGNKATENDNSNSASSWGVQVKQWNKMVRLNYEIHRFLIKNNTDYPDFIYNDVCFLPFLCVDFFDYAFDYYGLFAYLQCFIPEIYKFKNSLGL